MATKLFCLVEGQSVSNAFPVDIQSAMTIGDLKDAIKAKKTNDFGNIDADRLVLWRVFIPDDKQSSFIAVSTLVDKTELSKPRTLSKLFPKSPDDNTYIIVQRRLPAQGSRSDFPYSSRRFCEFGDASSRRDGRKIWSALVSTRLTTTAVDNFGYLTILPLPIYCQDPALFLLFYTQICLLH